MKSKLNRFSAYALILGFICGFSILFFFSDKNPDGTLSFNGELNGIVIGLIIIMIFCFCFAIFNLVRIQSGGRITKKTLVYTAIVIPIWFAIVWWINS